MSTEYKYEGYNMLRLRGLRRLLTNIWPHLEELDLERCELEDSGLDVLLSTKQLPSLQILDIRNLTLN